MWTGTAAVARVRASDVRAALPNSAPRLVTVMGASLLLRLSHPRHVVVRSATRLAAAHHRHPAAASAHARLLWLLRGLVGHRIVNGRSTRAAAHTALGRSRSLGLLTGATHLGTGRLHQSEEGERAHRYESSHEVASVVAR